MSRGWGGRRAGPRLRHAGISLLAAPSGSLGGHWPPSPWPFLPCAQQGSPWQAEQRDGGVGEKKMSGRPRARRPKLAFLSPRGVSSSGVPSPSAPNNGMFGVGDLGRKTKWAAQSLVRGHRSWCGTCGAAWGRLGGRGGRGALETPRGRGVLTSPCCTWKGLEAGAPSVAIPSGRREGPDS